MTNIASLGPAIHGAPRSVWAVLGVFLLLVGQGACSAEALGSQSPGVKLAVPIDADSPSAWSLAISGAPYVSLIILNPSNGPGQESKQDYASLVRDAQDAGIKVLGYVHTHWADGSVSTGQAEDWIDQYYSWYHVDGIMLDEANATCSAAPLGYYGALSGYVKAKAAGATVMLNPGEPVGQCYAGFSDILLTFEGNFGNYTTGYTGGGWESAYPPGRFFHIVFGVPTASEMKGVVETAKSRGAGLVFVTDLDNSLGNPYSALPSYFEQEVAFVAGLDRAPGPSTSQGAAPLVAILGLTLGGSLLVFATRKRALGRGTSACTG